jgi:hypothetical protein
MTRKAKTGPPVPPRSTTSHAAANVVTGCRIRDLAVTSFTMAC